METSHRIYFANSQKMTCLPDNSVDLIVTSPPYPMIEMWDEVMCSLNPDIRVNLDSAPSVAFEQMHVELDKVWSECERVLKPGCFLCINIGDATRTVNKSFSLYSNHSRILQACVNFGFTNLPNIIWRKQTNAPNKFMGSGMLPNGAYVTLEHEWILVFRKGGIRSYKGEAEKAVRRHSAFFWEERNKWFSDIWDLKGVKQQLSGSASRSRNASYPFMVPYRLISMYSQWGDTVLDPFLGLGTTSLASMVAGRNSIGIEIDTLLRDAIVENLTSASPCILNNVIHDRLKAHLEFVNERRNSGKDVKYENQLLGCPVMTKQEVEMVFHPLTNIEWRGEQNTLTCQYSNLAPKIMECSQLRMFG